MIFPICIQFFNIYFEGKCYTVGGTNSGKPCIFPFIWNGQTFNGKIVCTNKIILFKKKL